MSNRFLVVAAALLSLPFAAAAAMKIGEVAPDFARDGLGGKQVRLSDHRGKLVLLNFWAAWCAPCREEMPTFSKWQEEFRAEEFQVIGVSMDDDVAEATDFLKAHPVSYPVIIGDAKLAEHFGGVLGLPLSYLIDAQGRVVARYEGEPNLSEMEARVRELLARPRQ